MACSQQRSIALGDLAAGRLREPAVTELLDHIEECPACSRELDLLADLATAGAVLPREGAGSPSGSPRRFTIPRMAVAAAILGLAVLTGILVFQVDDGGTASGFGDLARLDPLPVSSAALRSSDASEDEGYREALAAYEEGDFEAAALGFKTTLASHPEHARAAFYRGVSLLQTGQTESAIAELVRAEALGEGLLEERALWYLANAFLSAGNQERAVAFFEELVRREGDYELNAKDRLDAIAKRVRGEE